MTGGTISGNFATAGYGGGVYIYSGASGAVFTKTGGTIYGDTDTTHYPGSNENTAGTGTGHAVYIEPGSPKKRNTDAGTSVNLNSGTGTNWQ
jgi:hypothetical protein